MCAIITGVVIFSGMNSKQVPQAKEMGGDWGSSFGKAQPLPGITGGMKAGNKISGGYVSSFMGSGKKQASKLFVRGKLETCMTLKLFVQHLVYPKCS